MAIGPFNAIDIAILSAVFAVMALIVRGMVRGTVKTCDPTSCSGNCHSCHIAGSCPSIKLSEAQLAELAAIDQRAKEMELS